MRGQCEGVLLVATPDGPLLLPAARPLLPAAALLIEGSYSVAAATRC